MSRYWAVPRLFGVPLWSNMDLPPFVHCPECVYVPLRDGTPGWLPSADCKHGPLQAATTDTSPEDDSPEVA